MRKWILRFGPRLALTAALFPWAALARVGGGEHYTSSQSDSSSGDGGVDGELIYWLFWLIFRYPKVGIPVAIVVGVGFYMAKRNTASATTQRAFQQREAEIRTRVSSQEVSGWVNALKLKDPSFELQPLLDKASTLFVQLQQAWFKGDLTPIRPFVSDAVFQRFNVQLRLLAAQGVRDAIAEISVLDLQLIGLDQSEWFDTVHLRVKAQMRDADVPASYTEPQALAMAKKAPLEAFTEVWSFVRKPGAKTKIGEDLYQGKCPNCGAPFAGGATNSCGYCGAVVNSGNFDWTLSTITQGIEHVRHYATVDGLLEARQTDPALNLEVLEDRATLLFWKLIDAQGSADPSRIAKVATGELQAKVDSELSALKAKRRRKVFLECAVGGVTTRVFQARQGPVDLAHVEIRWSARMAIGPEGEKPPPLPTVPQRWILTLSRKTGATTSTANGLSTNRCLQCNAPLSDSSTSRCDYCGAELAEGERDWVLANAASFEAWNSAEQRKFEAANVRRNSPSASSEVQLVDVQERQRLLYMMAALATSDGAVDPEELKLLKMCASRWSIPWANVELALSAGPQLFDRLAEKGTPEAKALLEGLVQMAMIDGRVDRRERQLLERAASHLGVREELEPLLQNAQV